VLGLAREWRQRHIERGGAFHILMGNHEEMLLEALERVEVLRHFVTYGGKETILSLGVPEATYAEATWDELQTMLVQAFNGEWLDFVRRFETLVRIGDYAFAHAGVRPDTPLEAQTQGSALDSRTFPFQHRRSWCGGGGHTISDEPVQRSTGSALIRGPMPRAA
jgi:serine/threonine protein phosphatase 1